MGDNVIRFSDYERKSREPDAVRRVANNLMIIDRLTGAPAQPATPEDDRDPRNPNNTQGAK